MAAAWSMGLSNRVNEHKPHIARYWPLLSNMASSPAKATQGCAILAVNFLGGYLYDLWDKAVHTY